MDEARKLGIGKIEIDVAHCNPGSQKVVEHIRGEKDREITIPGGDNKKHSGTRYIVIVADN